MTPTVSLIVRSPAVTPPQGLAARLRNLRDRAAAGEDIVTPVTAAELDLMAAALDKLRAPAMKPPAPGKPRVKASEP